MVESTEDATSVLCVLKVVRFVKERQPLLLVVFEVIVVGTILSLAFKGPARTVVCILR
jgi:hypothetical protein